MLMHSEKNKYGGNTFEIRIEPFFVLLLNGTSENNVIVEFKEFRFFRFKTKWTFVSSQNIENTIYPAFDKVLEYFETTKEYIWSEDKKNNMAEKALKMFRNFYLNQSKPKIDSDGFVIIDQPGEYELEIYGEPKYLMSGVYEIHFKAKTPDHFVKRVDDDGNIPKTLFLQVQPYDMDYISEIKGKAICVIDYSTNLKTGQKYLTIKGLN
mgnify:CR=1 FL=1